MNPRVALRELLSRPGIRQVPGVYDGITARLAEQAGFPALFVTGNGLAAALLGAPDVGLVTMTESLSAARGVAGAVEVPVIHDADTGYGGALNVVRTVREAEAAGLAGVTLEDQVTPKRCGILDAPPAVVPQEEFLARVRAAVWARRDGLVVIARTDAMRGLGLDAAIERCRLAVDSGADAVMVVGLAELSQVRRVATEVDAPLVVLVHDSGGLSDCSPTDLGAAGAALAVHPGTVRAAVVAAAGRALRALRADGTSVAVRGDLATAAEWNEVTAVAAHLEMERRFLDAGGLPADVTGTGR
ncbi:isocitrate lyase/PEP mutase family protein [Blastococcus saxobsidens]|uniref:isocitrate lyase/PEP mutase family protein n=1 Tax=Blastococcus saxobsidens TaxID=138336 RepID=UPI00131506ED|nr:isocitrate lyase/PEP mutase family protein [Blastococcus saxobsidens]